MNSYIPSTPQSGQGFIPSGPPGSGNPSSGQPVVPSPVNPNVDLQGQHWHPGGQQQYGGAQDWMQFGDSSRGNRPSVYPHAQPWVQQRPTEQGMRNNTRPEAMQQHRGIGIPGGWGGSPLVNPMVNPMLMGHSPMMAPGMMPQMAPPMGTPWTGMMNPQMMTPGMYPYAFPGMSPGSMGMPASLDEPEIISGGRNRPYRARPAGKGSEDETYVGQWAAGPHYGPTLNPRLMKILHITPRINPLLLPPAVRGDAEYLQWNMLFPDSSIHLSSDPDHRSWHNGRDAPATLPRTDALTIISPSFRWSFSIQSRRSGTAITCGELLTQLYKHLHILTLPDDYNSANPKYQVAIYEAWTNNRSRNDPNVPGGSLPPGMIRADFLGRNTMFEGFTQDSELSAKHLGYKSKEGADPCVLILLCGPRPVAGGVSPGREASGLPPGSPGRPSARRASAMPAATAEA